MKRVLLFSFAFFVFLLAGCPQKETQAPPPPIPEENLFDLNLSALQNGTRLVVVGITRMEIGPCTEMYCGSGNPCCNSCGGTLVLRGGNGRDNTKEIGLSGKWLGKEVGCGGKTCNITCYPMQENKKYEVAGTVQIIKYFRRPYLIVENFTEVK